jgi:cobalt-precorrin-5B (C1)-methyltransferase
LIENQCDRLIFEYLTNQITQRATAYIQKYTDRQVEIKTILCDRLGQLVL